MPFDAVLLHLLALVLPAWLLGFGLALITRLIWKVNRLRLSFWANWAALGLTGNTVLLAGLLMHGEDGAVLTYAALVLATASVQWAVVRGKKPD